MSSKREKGMPRFDLLRKLIGNSLGERSKNSSGISVAACVVGCVSRVFCVGYVCAVGI